MMVHTCVIQHIVREDNAGRTVGTQDETLLVGGRARTRRDH